MAFDWQDYVEVSRFLQRQTSSGVNPEAFLRSALSRAYYGAFCHARNYARDWLGFRPRYEGDDHGRLRAHLKKSKRWRVSEKLERLRDWRNDCDYRDLLTFDPQIALGSALADADYVVTNLTPPAGSSPP
jgi:hypothetical protein